MKIQTYLIQVRIHSEVLLLEVLKNSLNQSYPDLSSLFSSPFKKSSENSEPTHDI